MPRTARRCAFPPQLKAFLAAGVLVLLLLLVVVVALLLLLLVVLPIMPCVGMVPLASSTL
jgi:hypothetical protein